MYKVDTAAVFGEGKSRLWFININVGNRGGAPAKQVRIVGSLPASAIIADKAVNFSSGLAGTYADRSTSNRLDIIVPTMIPEEQAQISLLVRQSPSQMIRLRVRSDAAFGSELSAEADSRLENRTIRYLALGFVVFGGIFLQLVVPKFVLKKIRGRGRYRRQDAISTAFMLMHRGMLNEAESIFAEILHREGGGSVLLSDYGTSLVLQGNSDRGDMLMNAAESWAMDTHDQAVCAFNRSVVSISSGNYESGRKSLERAYALSSDEIDWYCQSSIYIQKAIEADPGIRELVAVKQSTLKKQTVSND